MLISFFPQPRHVLFIVFVLFIVSVFIIAPQYNNIRDITIYFASHIVPFEKKIINSKDYRIIVKKYENENESLGSDVSIFLGDSHIKKFDLSMISSVGEIVNRGIKGDTTLGVLSRLDQTANNIDAKKLFLMIGYNDIKYRDIHSVIENYIDILETISAEYIYVFSLLPVNSKRTWVNKRIRILNKGIKELSVKYGFEYIDLYSSFFDPRLGGIKTVYDLDGTHLNHSGYKQWKDVIENYFEVIERDIKEN